MLTWLPSEKLCLIDGTIAFMGGLDMCKPQQDLSNGPFADEYRLWKMGYQQ